jgi:hypothetical protein
MKYENVKRIAETNKAGFHSAVWERPLKTRAAHKDKYIVKRTYGTALRFGVNYDAMGAVQEKREKGDLPTENQGLIGRHWIIPNVILESDKTGKKLLRVSLAKNSTMETQYFLNGRPVQKSEIEQYVLKSEVENKHQNMEVFDIGIDNIISIN